MASSNSERSSTPVSEQAVFGLVRKYFPEQAEHNLKDDAALFSVDGHQVITTDTLVSGRHFDSAYCTAADIAHKAAHVSLSDVAAMGAVPSGLVVSLSLPKEITLAWVDEFYAQLAETLKAVNCPLLGGDTVASSELSITTTALGRVPQAHVPARRFLAKPDYVLALWGNHGLSAVGLHVLQRKVPDYPAAILAHKRPTAGIEAAQQLLAAVGVVGENSKRIGIALTDTSDGLADAALNIAEASSVRCVLDANAIPIPDEVRQWHDNDRHTALNTVLYGGEDFGLLAAVPANTVLPNGWTNIGGVATGQVGHAATSEEPGAEIRLDCGNTVPLNRQNTYQHF